MHTVNVKFVVRVTPGKADGCTMCNLLDLAALLKFTLETQRNVDVCATAVTARQDVLPCTCESFEQPVMLCGDPFSDASVILGEI